MRVHKMTIAVASDTYGDQHDEDPADTIDL